MSEPDPETVALAHRLFDLARAGDLRLIDYLEAGAPVELTDAAGNTLVMLAAYHGSAGLVSALAAHGADLNRMNDRGQTPLAGAVFKGETAVVDALLAGGADPELGAPSAVAAARFFGQDALLARLLAR